MTRFSLVVANLLTLLAAVQQITAADTPTVKPPEESYEKLPNLLANGSFEMDWMHNRVTANSRFMLMEQSDWGYAQSDGLPDLWVSPSSAQVDRSTAKFGPASLRLQGTVTQVVYLAVQTDPRDGGSNYNAIGPLPPNLGTRIKPKSIRIGCWCKTEGVAAASPPTLGAVVEHLVGDQPNPRGSQAAFSAGTHDWEYREVVISSAGAPAPAADVVVRLTNNGPGIAWFEGAFVIEEPTDEEPNLLPNGNFEEFDNNKAKGWSEPELWTWTRRHYYRFNGWSHDKGTMKGGATIEALGRSVLAMQLTVLPGDNLAVKSSPVAVNQTEARPLRVSAWIWADNLRWMEIMAQDESGAWLPQLDFSGMMGTDEQYRNRITGAGTHDWEYVAKYFTPSKPVKSLTIWLCARGIDGAIFGKNVVGTVRFDDVALREIGTPTTELQSRGVIVPAIAPPSGTRIEPAPLVAATPPSPIAINLGAVYAYPEPLALGVNLNITQASLGEVIQCRIVVKHPGGEKEVANLSKVPTHFWKAGDPRPALLEGGFADARNLLALTISPEGLPVHLFTEPVRDCRVEVSLVGHGKTIVSATSEPFGFMQRPPAETLPEKIEKTEINPEGFILVNGKPYLFNCFRVKESDDLGAMSRMVNFPKTHKILPLPFPRIPDQPLFTAAEDEVWKKKVQDFVAANKNDPKLFGYFFPHGGETSMWFGQMKELAECEQKVTAWVREVDPNHIILSAEWFYGAGTLKPDRAKPFGFLDVIDVEPSFTEIPNANAVRAAVGRPLAVIAGLECYYGQPINVVRWRTYEMLRNGVNGIGICPSGMLRPSNEKTTYLRGLYGEIAGLSEAITGSVPSDKTTANNPDVAVWERHDGKHRYVFALGNKSGPTPGDVTLTLPVPAAKVDVLFEGRSIAVSAGKFTDKFEPYAVHVYRVAN